MVKEKDKGGEWTPVFQITMNESGEWRTMCTLKVQTIVYLLECVKTQMVVGQYTEMEPKKIIQPGMGEGPTLIKPS